MDDSNKGTFTKFPNDILEALYTRRLSPLHVQIMLYVIRRTYGYGKPRDRIAISRMAREIGRGRWKASSGVSDLVKMGMLGSETPTRKGRVMWIKQPSEWEITINNMSLLCTENGTCAENDTCTENGTVYCTENDTSDCTEIGTLNCTENGTHKRKEKKTIKENILKKPPKPPIEESEAEASEEWVDDLPPDDDPRWQG